MRTVEFPVRPLLFALQPLLLVIQPVLFTLHPVIILITVLIAGSGMIMMVLRTFLDAVVEIAELASPDRP